MKKCMIAAFVVALALTGAAHAQISEKTPVGQPTKPATKKLTLEEIGAMLEDMGYNPKPIKNKDGKLVSYEVEVTQGSTTIRCFVDLSPSGQVIWFSNILIKFDEKTPATQEVLLGMLAAHSQLWPAYVVYFPTSKTMELSMPLQNQDVAPAALRNSLDTMVTKFLIVLEAYKKAKAQEAVAKEPSPLP